MRRLALAAPIVLAAGLAACTTATPFQPADVRGLHGYEVQQIEQNRFRLSFNGNQLTPRGQVEDDLTYLAAQVTVKNGYDYFILEDHKTDQTTAYPTYLGPDYGPGWGWGGGWGWGWGGGWGGWGGGWGGGPGLETDFSNPNNEYNASGDILLFKGTKPADNPHAYDARDVLARLTPVINRTNAAPGPY